jgi:hypothetical protein
MRDLPADSSTVNLTEQLQKEEGKRKKEEVRKE